MTFRRWYLITGNVFVANSIAMALLWKTFHIADCALLAMLSLGVGIYSIYRGYSM